jgi:hypothetical protein
MPGDGFTTWNYVDIAQHFYQKYFYDQSEVQTEVFEHVVSDLTKIVEKESLTGNLDRTLVWSWCTLQSGKHWPLSKWIRVNTCAPYKKAYPLIKKSTYEI